MYIKNSFILTLTLSILFTGCEDKQIFQEENTKQEIQTPIKIQKEVSKEFEEKKEKPNIILEEKPKENLEKVFNEVFENLEEIKPKNKPMMMIFGVNTDPYTKKLKDDILNSLQIQNMIKKDFSSYYFKAHENLRHKHYSEGKMISVDTNTLLAINEIEATPTIVFTDKQGKTIFVVPGYIPENQLLVTLKYVLSNKWKNKNRKNGDVYRSLRDYYLENGIDIIKR